MAGLGRLWLLPPADLVLSSDEVHVWRASLDLPAPRVQSLRHILTPDELERAERFRFDKDRRHFIVGRGLLRIILGRYLDIEPGELRFCYNDYGKPTLAPASRQKRVSFNLSHSDDLALYAITRDREIGIDLEHVRPIAEAERIAERFFSVQENAVLRTLPAVLKHETFFTYWTRKEAYIKGKGKGLSMIQDQFDVSRFLVESKILLKTRGDSQEATQWSLYELSPGPGYVSTLAVAGHGWRLKCWEWPE